MAYETEKANLQMERKKNQHQEKQQKYDLENELDSFLKNLN